MFIARSVLWQNAIKLPAAAGPGQAGTGKRPLEDDDDTAKQRKKQRNKKKTTLPEPPASSSRCTADDDTDTFSLEEKWRRVGVPAAAATAPRAAASSPAADASATKRKPGMNLLHKYLSSLLWKRQGKKPLTASADAEAKFDAMMAFGTDVPSAVDSPEGRRRSADGGETGRDKTAAVCTPDAASTRTTVYTRATACTPAAACTRATVCTRRTMCTPATPSGSTRRTGADANAATSVRKKRSRWQARKSSPVLGPVPDEDGGVGRAGEEGQRGGVKRGVTAQPVEGTPGTAERTWKLLPCGEYGEAFSWSVFTILVDVSNSYTYTHKGFHPT